MIFFNFKFFFRLVYLSLFKATGTHARWTKKRVGFLVSYALTFIPLQLVHGFFLALDWVFFPGFRRVAIHEPVFIIGNPRTGTTHLLRVLAQDEETFAVAKWWELVLAPSITQRKLVRAFGRLDRWLGGHLRKRLFDWEKRAFHEREQYHRRRLEQADEDELMLMTIFSAIHLVFAFPFLDEFREIIYFDRRVSAREKQRFMTFYRRCMQRTLYLYGPEKHYLSKSPANSGRVGTLHDAFPEARFIYMARTPLDVFPSIMSLFSYQCNNFNDLLTPYPFGEEMLEMTKHWYRYPIQVLEGNDNPYKIVQYENLVGDLGGTVRSIYDTFGLEMRPDYVQVLKQEVRKANNYTSRHEYELEEMGYSKEQILAAYRDAIKRFGFET